MDIEEEMRRLQAEARDELARRDAETQLPPTPIPQAVKEANAEPEADEPSLADEMRAKSAALKSAVAGKVAAEVFKPEILLEAGKLAEAATEGSGMSLGAKAAMVVGGLIVFLIAWELILGPLVMALISIAVLGLIVTGILKLTGFFDSDDDDEPDPS